MIVAIEGKVTRIAAVAVVEARVIIIEAKIVTVVRVISTVRV